MQKLELNLLKWRLSAERQWEGSVAIKHRKHRLYVRNEGGAPVVLTYFKDVLISDKQCKNLQIRFSGENMQNGGGCLYINDNPITLNGLANMEITPPVNLSIKLSVPADSIVEVHSIELLIQEDQQDLTEQCNHESDVLVITPDYPSTHNLYLCAFAHSRNREYVKAGLKIQVASISPMNWYQAAYKIDDVPVFSGRPLDLKNLLNRHQYKVVVVHFVDEYLYPIFDGYIQNERLIFICHGPETVFRYLPNRCGQYFVKELPELDTSSGFDCKEKFVTRYARKENVDWVFVSEWLKDFSEKMLNTKFINSHIIYNTINEELFPYIPKSVEHRKKILVLRKFDNVRQHSIDQVTRAIEELSRRDFFSDLTFEVYGDGNYYDVLTGPLEKYSNVHLHRTFVPNDQVHKLHAQNGILLIPSRHDAHAVAMSEGASSGLVVIGSDVTSNGFFMNQEVNHTLADPEDPVALADIIERLYRNPDEYLEISERMSREVQTRCNRGNTVMKEVALIKETRSKVNKEIPFLRVSVSAEPVLTIVVPAYNVEDYLAKCIYSLIFHRNAGKTEVIIVNDGSTDKTLEIARSFECAAKGIVRVIDKKNGGHGSTINVGMAEARGKYFRLIDGDDWVDSENLAELVDKLEFETADVVLTKGCYEYVDKAELTNIIDYDMLREGTMYHFEDLIYPGYGFDGYGPLLTTGNYRTEALRKAAFLISEKRPYVDMEFNSFALRYVETLKYYDLDIYRYLIGREGQTVSRDFWKKKYKDHKNVILNILRTIEDMQDYSDAKKKYVYEHLTALMIDSQIFMFDQLCLWEEIDVFLDELNDWPDARKAGLEYIEKKYGDCKVILENYHDKIEENAEKRTPIIGGNAVAEKHEHTIERTWKWYLKKIVKMCVPYGILRLYQLERYPDGI